MIVVMVGSREERRRGRIRKMMSGLYGGFGR